MATKKAYETISVAAPHTIKKFELISEYAKAWVEKLMNYDKCEGIVFIDCMSNSGLYKDSHGKEIEGTPLRVSKIISEAMKKYPKKKAFLYFNDLSNEKIELLESRLPQRTENFIIHTEAMDGNSLLNSISSQFEVYENMNFLLLYDPYDAAINWEAITPFLNSWGEVIINHMISDTVRAARNAKKEEAVKKYEQTYQMDIEKLISIGSDKSVFESVIEEIIQSRTGEKEKYIAVFPFVNTNNALVYNLIHVTGNLAGFRLFKKTAWKVFGDKSSIRESKNDNNQLSLIMDTVTGDYSIGITTDQGCYYPRDMARYLQNIFYGQYNVSMEVLWSKLDQHPIFPSEGYRNEIKKYLKEEYGDEISKSSINFSDRRI